MITNIRQGIISTQSSEPFLVLTAGKVNINVDVAPVNVTFAYGTADYLFTETTSVIGAWGPFQSGVTSWLYLDIDLITGVRTFGSTSVTPSFGSSLPTSSITVDQHFFDLSTKKMKVWNGRKWNEKIRVFAGQIINGVTLVLNTVGTSQVGLNGVGTSGYILFDQNQLPLKAVDRSGNNYFITSETLVHTQFDAYNSYKISATINTARAIEPIPAYYAVCFKGANQVGVASNINFQYPCAGISLDAFGKDESKKFITDGFITNSNYWNFPDPPSTPLFVGIDGSLTTTVPQSYSLQKVGFVVAPDTVFIDIQEIILIEQIAVIGPSPTPTATPTATPIASITPTLTPTPSVTLTPTPTPTSSPTPIPLASLYVGGQFSNVGGYNKFAVINSDDTANQQFKSLGSNINGEIDNVCVTSTGQIYVVGSINGTTDGFNFNNILKMNSSGVVDQTYSLMINGEVQFMTEISTGKFYIGGSFTLPGNGSDQYTHIARLNPDGTLDTSFPVLTTDGYISSILEDINNNIYLIGSFSQINSSNYTSVARLNPDGTLDTTFIDLGLTIYDSPYKAIQDSTNKIYLTGYFTAASYQNLMRLNSDGTIDDSFVAITIDSDPLDIIISNNKFYLIGGFSQVDSQDITNIFRLNSDGTLDTDYTGVEPPTGFLFNQIYGICSASSNSIYIVAALYPSSGGSGSHYAILKLDSTGQLDSNFTDPLNFNDTIVNITYSSVNANSLYVSSFGQALSYDSIQRIYADGSLDNSFSNIGLNPQYTEVYDSLRATDQSLYFAGSFNGQLSDGFSYNGIVKLNSSGEIDETYNSINYGGKVMSLCQTADDKIYVGGDFIFINNDTRHDGLARLNSDGTLDETFVLISNNDGNINKIIQSNDQKIYVGGAFTFTAPETSTVYTQLMRLNSDGTLDTDFIPINIIDEITGIIQTTDEKIYIVATAYDSDSGQYQYIGKIIRLNSDGTLDGSFTEVDSNKPINCIYQSIDEKIYVGGEFTTIYADSSYPYLTRLNSDGTLDTTFGAIDYLGVPVHSICQTNYGDIVIGSDRYSFGIVRIQADGSAYDTQPVSPNQGGIYTMLAINGG